MKILLSNFHAIVGWEIIYQSTIENESVHTESNDSGIRQAYFATSKSFTVNSIKYPNYNIHKYNWTSPEAIYHVLIDRRKQICIIDIQSLGEADCDTDFYLVVTTIQDRLSWQNKIKKHLVADRYNLNILLHH